MTILPANGQAKTGSQAQPGGSGFASVDSTIPGFSAPRRGDWKFYRDCSAHPTIALVQAVALKPVERGSWNWKRKTGVSEDREKFIREMFDGNRASTVRDALDAVSMGCAMFEKVYEGVGKYQVITELKPLALEKSQIQVTAGAGGGKFAGIVNNADGVKAVLPPENCWLYTHDKKQGNLYGRSRHENIRKHWCRGEDVAEKFFRYLQKISNTIFQLHYPDGTSKDAAGADRPNWWLAADLLQKVSNGQNVALVNKFASFLAGEDGHITPAALEKALAAAGQSDWVFSFMEPKGPDHAQGFLDTLAYYDKLYFRGWLRPERTALEAQKGGLGTGDAEQHSEVGMLDAEAIAADITLAFNKDVVDDVLVANFGEGARGSVWAEPSPLVDTTVANAIKLLEAAFANQQIAPAIAAGIDWDTLLDEIEIPVAGKVEAGSADVPVIPAWSVVARMRKMIDQSQQQPIQMNAPSKPANPQKVQKMSRAAVRRARKVLAVTGWAGADQ